MSKRTDFIKTLTVGTEYRAALPAGPEGNTPYTVRISAIGDGVVLAKLLGAGSMSPTELPFNFSTGRVVRGFGDKLGVQWLPLPASDEELAEAEAVFSKRGNLHIIRNSLARLSPRAIARIAAAVLAEIASA